MSITSNGALADLTATRHRSAFYAFFLSELGQRVRVLLWFSFFLKGQIPRRMMFGDLPILNFAKHDAPMVRTLLGCGNHTLTRHFFFWWVLTCFHFQCAKITACKFSVLDISGLTLTGYFVFTPILLTGFLVLPEFDFFCQLTQIIQFFCGLTLTQFFRQQSFCNFFSNSVWILFFPLLPFYYYSCSCDFGFIF